MTVNLSVLLTIFVAILLIIDIAYRVRFPKQKQEVDPAKESRGVIKEFFRDYKDQLSWTRLALSILLGFGLLVIVAGLLWPSLWDKCKEIFNVVLEWCKWLFGISKTPEAVNQVSNMLKPPPENK